MKIILLNGPPRVGKDYAAELIARMVEGSVVGVKIAEVLKDMTHRFYGMEGLSHDGCEDFKDIPCPGFYGLTPRQAYIAMSENFIKPTHGEGWLGVMLAAKIRARRLDATFVVSDAGFLPECEELVKEFGAKNIMLVRLHRHGYDFKGDSRDYIDMPGIRSHDVINTGKADFEQELADAIL